MTLLKKCQSEAGSRPKLNEILDELKNNPYDPYPLFISDVTKGLMTDSIDEYFNYIKYFDSNSAEPLLIDNEYVEKVYWVKFRSFSFSDIIKKTRIILIPKKLIACDNMF